MKNRYQRSVCFFLWLVAAVCSVGRAQAPLNLNGWQPAGGNVLAVAQDNQYVYLGGTFTRMIKPGTAGAFTRGTGVQTGSGAVINGFPIVNGTILAVAPDGSGGWYIAGEFTQVGGQARNRIARIMADNSVDLAWNPNANGTVRCIVVDGTQIYVGGD
ncbi:MAG: delta-60 repeat domain-containing protein, partial [Bernardetiaceae bacterium]|nr:delta-60 repeat domain-containing protein [Bernardetiaceae bacterium]